MLSQDLTPLMTFMLDARKMHEFTLFKTSEINNFIKNRSQKNATI